MFFYWIWVTDEKLITSMKESTLPEAEAFDLYHKYIESKKKYMKRMLVSFSIFLICGIGTILLQDYLPNEMYVYLPLLIIVFASILIAISSYNKHNVASEYVKALQKGYPTIS